MVGSGSRRLGARRLDVDAGGGRCGPCAANGLYILVSAYIRLYILVVCGTHKFRLREPWGGLARQTAGRGEVQEHSGPQSTLRVRSAREMRGLGALDAARGGARAPPATVAIITPVATSV